MSLRIDGDGKTVATDMRFEGSVVGTAPSGTGVSVLHTGVMPTMCHKVRLDYTALTGFAATTGDVTLWTLPTGAVVERVIAKVNTTFTGGAISDCDVTVGKSAGGAEYLASFDVDTAAVLAGDVVAEIGAGLVDSTRADVAVTSNAFVAATVQCRFTSVGANLSALTAGQMDIWIIYKQLPGA